MKKVICVLSFLSILVLPAVVNANGCRVVHHNVVQEVIVPVAIAVPVLVPAFQFQYIPAPVAYPVVGAPQPPAYVPGVPASASPAGFNLPSANQQDRIRALARALIEEMKKEELADAPPMAHRGEQPVSVNHLSALSLSCAQCHTGSTAKGGVRIFTAPGVVDPLAPKAKIWDAISTGRMPPTKDEFGRLVHRPSVAEAEAIRQWALGNF